MPPGTLKSQIQLLTPTSLIANPPLLALFPHIISAQLCSNWTPATRLPQPSTSHVSICRTPNMNRIRKHQDKQKVGDCTPCRRTRRRRRRGRTAPAHTPRAPSSAGTRSSAARHTKIDQIPVERDWSVMRDGLDADLDLVHRDRDLAAALQSTRAQDEREQESKNRTHPATPLDSSAASAAERVAATRDRRGFREPAHAAALGRGEGCRRAWSLLLRLRSGLLSRCENLFLLLSLLGRVALLWTGAAVAELRGVRSRRSIAGTGVHGISS